MERYSVFLQAALCLFYCGISDATPPPIPPDVLDSLRAGKDEMGYLLTMPQTLQAGAQEQYCLTLHGVTKDTAVTLELVDVERGDADPYTYTHMYIGGQSQCKTFKVPPIAGRYAVHLQNETDTFATSEVTVLGNNLITFVQTDKPMYKPGQKVKFRILTMTRNLRSRIGEIESVFIKDPNDYKVKRFANVESRGMASLEFQLIKEAKLGTWTIEVTVDGAVTTQTFKVQEYVLPRFEVTIDPPPYFLVSSATFDGKVCAKYTYGKPVKGFLKLQVCPTGYGSFGDPCVMHQADINGCHDFSVNSSELLGDRYYYGRRFSIDASVTEAGTGVQVNGTASGPAVTSDPLKMQFMDDSNGYFKPGMPVMGRLKVTKPDGTPAANEPVKVSASDHRNDVYMDKLFTTDQMGEIDYSICHGFLDNTSSLSMFAEAVNFEENMDVPYSRRLYRPTAHGSFRQWFSPSLSYIQIPARREPFKCGSTLQLNVPFTHNGLKPFVTFHYQVMARGRIVQAGTKDSPTIPDPLSFLDIGVNNCLEVKERPTPPPRPTIIPIVPLNEHDSNSSEIAPPGNKTGLNEPSLVEAPPIIMERSEILDVPREMQPRGPPMEPPMLSEMEEVRLQPVSEVVDLASRRKRSFAPPFEEGAEETIVRSEHISDQLSSFQLSINVTSDMSPEFSVLLYYIRDDGETVADSMGYKVDPCFDNEVRMEFSEEKVMPGAETKIHLHAAAGSVCGVGVVDKSVNILGGDHQITPAKVFENLAKYSLSTRGHYRYSYFRSDSNYCEDRMSKLEEEEEEEESSEEEMEDGEEPPVPERAFSYRSYSSSYVDAIQAFKQMGMLVLTNLDVETRPCRWSYPIYYEAMPMPSMVGGMPGPAGPVLRRPMPTRQQGGPSEKEQTRSDFPETWLWDLQMIGESGSLEYPVTVPHTITQWVGNSLCINDQAGFGLSPITSITTFKPFFLVFNLPYNAVRDERLPITVTVYNYLDKCLHMMLMVDGMKGFKVHRAHLSREPFCLCGGQSSTRKFYITAQDIGHLPIFARSEVIPGECGNEAQMDFQYVGLADSVQRKVLVKAEGVTQQYSHSVYICPKDGEEYTDEFELPLPRDIVPDSARGDITVIGDIMGPALTNLDHLVRMPTGCGEQNMVGFTPNIYVLKYLTITGRLTEVIEDKAKNFMEIGYQRELTYRHPDGSFSAFGPSNGKPGSTWLTAFVVKSFAQAKPYIFIDDKDLELSKSYLVSTQNPEEGPLMGCFFERGSVFSSYMQGGLGKNANDAALSAYVLIALLEAGLDREGPVAMTGIDCINGQLQNNPDLDVYTLALVAYVNALYSPFSDVTAGVMQRLDSKATVHGALKYWKREQELPKPVNSWHYYAAPSAEVEMTSYAVLAMMAFYEEDAVAQAQGAIYWLSQQRNAFGGYSSTQDTVLGLNALSEFATMTFSDQPTDLTLMMDNGKMKADFMINDDNSLLLQQQPMVVEGDSIMRVSASGTGCALVQANVRYNKAPSNLGIDDPKFTLRADPRNYRHDRNICSRRTIYITFGQRSGGQFSSGMTMLTVRMVTGWHVIPEGLRELRSMYPMLGIEREEVDEEEGVISFYLDELDLRTRRFALDVEQDRDLLISATKPAEVQIYQYYEKDVTVIKSYELRTTCGTKQEIPYDAPVSEEGGDFVQRRVDPMESLPNRPSELGNPEGPREEGPRGPRRPPLQSGDCPVCNLLRAPRNYQEIICNSTAVYKAHAGRNRQFSLKIKSNLRPRRKQKKLNWFANVRMAKGCQCSLLDPPQKNVIIITQEANLDRNNKTMIVDSRTYIFKRNRTLEKKARMAQKQCPMN